MKKHNPTDHTYSIYALECPIDNKIKYVGQTEDLRKRFMTHVQCPSKYTKDWIKLLKDKGLLPRMIELERVGLLNVDKREKYWIDFYRKKVGGLLNYERPPAFKLKYFPIVYLKE